MKKGCIGILDSGVGGLNVLKKLELTLSGQRFIYLGDNYNAPYGNKTSSELLYLSILNISKLISLGATSIVLACNTLSLTVLPRLIKIFDVPLFGVFPPAELFSLSNKKTLLLSTTRTAEYYKNVKNVTVVGLKDLAKDIENNVFNLYDIDVKSHLCQINSEYDVVILGCTHYPFIKNQICNHLKPQVIIDGIDYTSKMLLKIFNNKKSSDNSYRNEIFFVGDCAEINKKIWNLVVKTI